MEHEPEVQHPLSLRPDVVVTVLEDEAVLLDLESKYFYSVNTCGWSVVQMFESGTTLGRIHVQCEAWGAPEHDREAITKFLDVLVNDRLVTPASDSPAGEAVALKGGWSPPLIEKHKEPLQRIMVSAFDPSLPLAE